MVAVLSKWPIAVVLILAGVSCDWIPDYIKNSSVDDCITDAYNVAAVGIVHNYMSLGMLLSELERKMYPSHVADATESTTQLLMDGTKCLQYLGVNPKRVTNEGVVQRVEGRLSERPYLHKVDRIAFLKTIRDLGVSLKFTYRLCQRCQSYNEYKYNNVMDSFPGLLKTELPKVWIGPLHNLYTKLGIKDDSISKGEIYNRRIELLGCDPFQVAAVPLNSFEVSSSGFHHDLLVSTATGLIERMFKAIRNNVLPEDSAKIEELYQLYQTHSNVGL